MIGNILLWAAIFMGLALFGGFVFLVVWMRSFSKIEAEITDITSNGSIIIRDKVRFTTDKNGKAGWQFLKVKSPVGGRSRVIGVPPTKYVDLLSNGKKFVRFVKHGDDLSLWHPDFTDKLPTTEVFSGDDRQAYLYEMQKKLSYGKQSWRDIIITLMPFLVVGVVIVAGVVLYDTVGSTMLEISENVAQSLSRSTEVLERAVEILERVEGESIDFDDDGGAPN